MALSHGTVVVIQLVTFLTKVFVMCSFQILIRWTLPRFRYDQLMFLGWKVMLPISMINLILQAWLMHSRAVGA